MTGSRVPQRLKFDAVGRNALIFLAILLIPAKIVSFAVFLLVLAYFHWVAESSRNMSAETKRLFMRSAWRAPKIHKLFLNVAVIWLIKICLEFLGCLENPRMVPPTATWSPPELIANYLGSLGYNVSSNTIIGWDWPQLICQLPQAQLSHFLFLSAIIYMVAGAASLLSYRLFLPRKTALSEISEIHQIAAEPDKEIADQGHFDADADAGRLANKTKNCSKRQLWTDLSLTTFNVAFLLSLYSFTFGEAGRAISNWLIASARDANLKEIDNYTRYVIELFNSRTVFHPPEAMVFESLVKVIFAAVMFLLTSSLAGRLSVFLVSVVKRAMTRSAKELLDAPSAPVLEALRMKRSKMKLSETNMWFKHTSASFWWIVSCYLTLFWVFGLMGGPLGDTICQWFDCSLTSAHFGVLHVQALPPLHWFCGAIVALYGTVPLAMTGSIFLPFLKRKQVIVNQDGIFLPDGPRLSLWFRTFRTWDDFKSLALVSSKETDFRKRSIQMQFHSGGSLRLKVTQLSAADLHNLLCSIDENAASCQVTDDVLAIKDILAEEDLKAADTTELRNRSAENYMSTVFVPLQPGDYIRGRRARIVRLLASKPLAAVYLARDKRGNFLIVKQFFLADDTKETHALRKIFERECEILRKLKHRRIARVVDNFQDGCSSFLLLEHAKGSDLRSFIQDGGKKSETAVLLWAEQLAEIMKYLHEQDPPVVHRDLTPDNIVIAEDGMLQLIDFGAAHQFLEGITGTMIGKQCYTAPEQLRGNASPRSDIYSFGCTLYFLLTGEDPVALSQSSPANKVQLSPALDRLIRACTEFEETDRIQSFAQILEEINHCRNNPFWQGDQTAHLDAEFDNWTSDAPDSSGKIVSAFKSKTDSNEDSIQAFSSMLAELASKQELIEENETGTVISIKREAEQLS